MVRRSSMQGRTRSRAPQAGQDSTSMPNTRLRRRAQRLEARGRRRRSAPRRALKGTAASAPRRGDAGAQAAVEREQAVEPSKVHARSGHEGGQAGEEVERVEHDVGGAVAPGGLEAVAHVTVRDQRQALLGQGGAADVAVQALELSALGGAGADAGVQREPGCALSGRLEEREKIARQGCRHPSVRHASSIPSASGGRSASMRSRSVSPITSPGWLSWAVRAST